MTLNFTDALDRGALIRATDLVGDLIRRPEVAASWTRESTCARMSVGGLTRHLVSQPVNAVGLLGADPGAGAGAETIPLLEHYARASWVRETVEGEANRGIRETSDRQASEGPAAAVAVLGRARSGLEAVLLDPAPTIYVPWQGWSLTTDDFIVTRLMEMVVHADDLAASIEVEGPDFGPAVVDPVLRLLTALAVRRHGPAAVVRTLTRPQRAPATIAAF